MGRVRGRSRLDRGGAHIFDHNFGSWVSEPGIILGGYRGLEGKEIGADEFVDRIVDQYRPGSAAWSGSTLALWPEGGHGPGWPGRGAEGHPAGP